MKITLLYRKKRTVVEIGESDTVGQLKSFFRYQYSLNLKSAGESENMILTILFAGSRLKDDWIISDIGILPGSVLQCYLQSRDKIFLRALCGFNKKIYDFTSPISVDETTVGDLKRMIQEMSGIPVTVMRLCKNPPSLEMYDDKTLDDYDIMIGDTINVDIWDGMGDFLLSAFAGDVTITMNALVNPAEDPALHKYQLRVALCIASFHGYLQLISQLLKSGARCDDPVGEHPARSWCSGSLHHPLSLQTPTHAAAQTGKITCLRLFIHHNPACILPRDGYGCTPTGVARKYGQRECFKLLITEQFRKQQYSGLSLSVYAKVRKWCDRARDRVAYYRSEPGIPVLLATLDKTGHTAMVGAPIQMNGFGDSIQTSASKLNKTKIDTKSQWLWPKREQLGNMVKFLDEGRGPKRLYRTLPSVRKQNSFKAKNIVTRNSSLESVATVKGHFKRKDGGTEVNPRLRSKLSSESCKCSRKSYVQSNHEQITGDGCKCKDCLKCSCGGRFRLPDINDSKSMNFSGPSFFITQDAQNNDIKEESESVCSTSASLERKAAKEPSLKVSPRPAKNSSRELTEQAHHVIEQATGQTSRDLARSSLEVCETFTAVGWLRRLHLATNYNRKTLLRCMREKGHHLTTEGSSD